MYHNIWTPKYWKLKLSAVLLRTFVYLRRGTQRYLRGKPLQPEVTRETIYVPSRDKGRKIGVDLYRPANVDASVKLPVIVSWHGSGFLIPSWGEDREWAVQAIKALGCCVLDCDYRKAPEHPYPSAPDDADDVVGWVLSQTSRFDTTKVSLSGFSAGGALALASSNHYGSDNIKSVTVLYPPIDFDKDSSKELPDPLPKFHSGLIMPVKMVDLFNRCYIVDWDKPRPARMTIGSLDLNRFPKHMFIATGDVDTLYNGARNFADKMNKHGHKDFTFVSVKEEAHAWDKNPLGPESVRSRDDAYRQAFECVKRSWR